MQRLISLFVGLVLSLQLFASDAPLSTRALNNCGSFASAFRTGWLSKNPSQYFIPAQKLKAQLKDLNYIGVIAWEPHEANELMRKLVRYHGASHLGKTLPTYSTSQKLGRATVDIDEIRFSQVDCNNGSEGGYTVINNAKSFKEGTLKPSDLPALKVWRDTDGKIWSLDHRRLAAMRLSGVIENVEVEFVAKPIVDADQFKYATQTDGQAIFVRLATEPGKQPMAIVIGPAQKGAPQVARAVVTESKVISKPALGRIESIIKHVENSLSSAWREARGPEYLSRLDQYALDLEKAYKEIEPTSVRSFSKSFSEFGQVTGRAKSSNSILTKLVRKDLAAFEKNQTGITNLRAATAAIGDGIGGRLTFKAGADGVVSPSTVSGFVDRVIEEIEGGAGVTEIMNYRARGNNGLPYLSDAQIELIRRASERQRLKLQQLKNAGQDVTVPEPLIIKSGESATFADGYTAFHMNIKYKSGITAEIQVRGPSMNQAAEIKHLYYDLLAGKPLAPKYASNPKIMASVESFNSLSAGEKSQLMNYVEQQLIHARRVETGATTGVAPPLPAGLSDKLSFNYLKPHLIHD